MDKSTISMAIFNSKLLTFTRPGIIERNGHFWVVDALGTHGTHGRYVPRARSCNGLKVRSGKDGMMVQGLVSMSQWQSHHPTKQGIFHLQQIFGLVIWNKSPKKGHQSQPLWSMTCPEIGVLELLLGWLGWLGCPWPLLPRKVGS